MTEFKRCFLQQYLSHNVEMHNVSGYPNLLKHSTEKKKKRRQLGNHNVNDCKLCEEVIFDWANYMYNSPTVLDSLSWAGFALTHD